MIDEIVYLDNNATTRVDERVLAEMLPFFTKHYGNPASRYYPLAEEAKKAVETSRLQCAGLMGAKQHEIIFTSGATESNNIAIKGYCLANANKGKHIVTSLIEHRSVLDPIKELEKNGFNVSYVKPDPYGKVSAGAISEAITGDTILVSVMLANNELGTINPIDKIADVCQSKNVIFHCVACLCPTHHREGEFKIVPEEFAYNFSYVAGLRNFLAHDYLKETAPTLENFLNKGLSDVETFIGFAEAAQ